MAAKKKGKKSSSKKSPKGGKAALGKEAARCLDPRLVVAASRAAREKPADLGAPGGSKAKAAATPVSRISRGLHGLASQLSTGAVGVLKKTDRVPVLVDVADAGAVSAEVARWKGEATRLSGSSMLVQAPRKRLADLARLKGVRYVEASTKLRKHNDRASVSAGLRSEAAVASRIVPETGDGVLVGVVDTGLDVGHPGFKNGSLSRVVDYLDQEAGVHHQAGGTGRIAIAPARSQSPDTDGHGTHVAGIAAGNGEGSPDQVYQGVAPEADLAIVKTTFDSGDIAQAVAHIFDVADQREQPCVVNLSLGGHYGGHDGSSITERTIDELCDAPGRVVVVSAGNEGGSGLHAGTRLESGGRWVADIEITPRVLQGQDVGLLVVQCWTQWEEKLSVTLRSPEGQIFAPPDEGDEEFDRGHFIVTAIGQHAPYSADRSTTFQILTLATPQLLSGWSLIVEEGTGEAGKVRAGAVHAWILAEDMGRFSRGFTKSHLIGMPGTAFSAVTVASYATRGDWDSQDPGAPHVVLDAVNVEDVSYFSSPGPTREAHNKPEIAGPGQWLISALSSKASKDELPPWLRLPDVPYVALQGTSMAAPFVSGAIALLLEKNPDLHWAEVKRRLIKSAVTDGFTWPCWNERWGYGKIHVQYLLDVEPG